MTKPCAHADFLKVAKVYEAFGFPTFSEQLADDLCEWSGVARDRIVGFFRYAALNPAMRAV